jgi:hypothetical protein
MMPIVEHPAVRQEFAAAVRYYAEINGDLAVDFDATVDQYRDWISTNPEHFRIRAHGVRRVNLAPQFNELYLAYLIWNNRVVILALGHAKMRPFYFRRRIGEARKMV